MHYPLIRHTKYARFLAEEAFCPPKMGREFDIRLLDSGYALEPKRRNILWSFSLRTVMEFLDAQPIQYR